MIEFIIKSLCPRDCTMVEIIVESVIDLMKAVVVILILGLIGLLGYWMLFSG